MKERWRVRTRVSERERELYTFCVHTKARAGWKFLPQLSFESTGLLLVELSSHLALLRHCLVSRLSHCNLSLKTLNKDCLHLNVDVKAGEQQWEKKEKGEFGGEQTYERTNFGFSSDGLGETNFSEFLCFVFCLSGAKDRFLTSLLIGEDWILWKQNFCEENSISILRPREPECSLSDSRPTYLPKTCISECKNIDVLSSVELYLIWLCWHLSLWMFSLTNTWCETLVQMLLVYIGSWWPDQKLWTEIASRTTTTTQKHQ